MRFWSLQHSHSVDNKLPTNENGTVYSFVLNNSEGSHSVEIKYQRMKKVTVYSIVSIISARFPFCGQKRTIIEWKS